MSKTLKYVKEFDFGPQLTYVKGYARGGKCKTDYAMGGSCYAEGGKADIKQDKAMIKTAVHKHEKSMHKGEPLTKLKKGGKVMEKGTGERYPSRKAMMKHEREETPTMEREEHMERQTVRNADRGPSGGPGMRRNMGALGMIANKNPGERRGVPVAPNTPMITPMKKGGIAVSNAGMGKMKKVMGEYKRGDLHSGSSKGPKVTNPKQAVAIALSEARNAGKKRK
jgi:hypothetical protein